jgi:hypothetical protein
VFTFGLLWIPSAELSGWIFHRVPLFRDDEPPVFLFILHILKWLHSKKLSFVKGFLTLVASGWVVDHSLGPVLWADRQSTIPFRDDELTSCFPTCDILTFLQMPNA